MNGKQGQMKHNAECVQSKIYKPSATGLKYLLCIGALSLFALQSHAFQDVNITERAMLQGTAVNQIKAHVANIAHPSSIVAKQQAQSQFQSSLKSQSANFKKFNPEYNIANGLAPTDADQKISVLEAFQGEFRILGSKEYSNDEQAKFSPIDYAVTRGVFTRPDIARQISISQYDRFLNWQMARPPLPPQVATQLVSNMHIIPANPEIAAEIKKVKRGDLVHLTGDLVQINDKGLVWKSALDWNGVGDGACKLIRVDSIQWIEKQNI